LTATTSKGLISLIYTARYAAAADPLRILIFGSMMMFLSSLATTIMMAMGKLRIIAAIVALRIGLGFGLNYVLIPVYGLNGAALGISVVSSMSALAGLVYISRRFGRLIDPLSLTKIIGAATVTALPGLIYDFTGLWLVISWAVLLTVYGLLLVLLKEVGQEEWLTLKRAIVPRAVK
jgi:O-antigen/teichoic acid export membrane protein